MFLLLLRKAAKHEEKPEIAAVLREHGGRTASGIFDIAGSQASTSGSDLPLANDRLWPIGDGHQVQAIISATDPKRTDRKLR